MFLPLAVLLALGQAPPAAPALPAALPAIRGVLVDAATNAPVAGAQVSLVEIARAVRTDADGRFAFDAVPPGRHTLTVSLIGYIFVRREVELAPDALIDLTVPLSEGTGTYQETVSVAPPPAVMDVGVGSQRDLGSAALQDLRSVAADDPMRAVQALPGVATGDDFQAQFSVRGSQFRHVGIVLDGTATPLLMHTVRSTNETASIAMINTDVLDRASLLAGAHPRRHGDWLGATLDFDLREGSRDRAAVRGAVSATSAALVIEGPIGGSKRGSWLASMRKSYIDWLVRKLYPDTDATLGFADVQSKIAYDLTPRQRLQFTLIAGNSGFRDDDTSLANGIHLANSKTALSSIVWRYTRDKVIVSQRVSSVHATFYDLGRVDQELGRGHGRSLIWRGDASWFPAAHWTIEGGAKSEWQTQAITQRNFRVVNNFPQERFVSSVSERTDIASVWAHIARRTPASGVSLGARVTHDTWSGRTVASPWLMGERTVGAVTFRASAGVSHQFPELELQRGLPDRVPERAESADAGIDVRLPHGMHWQLAGFWSRDTNVIRRIGETRLTATGRVPESTFPQFSSALAGRTHGVDVVFSRRAAAGLTGWASYTYARTREHDRVTLEDFDGDFDQRHTINVFVQERLSYRTAVSAKLRIGSNFPLVGYFQRVDDEYRLHAERNRARLPAYARLDIRASRTFTYDRRRLTLFAEIVNATGRENLGQAPGQIVGPTFTAVEFTQKLLPFLPSAGVLLEF
jgi:hypothetical protein